MRIELPALLVALFLSGAIWAQPGTIDPTFNTIDPGNGKGDGTNGDVMALAVQADGHIVVGGSFSRYNGPISENLLRLMPDGTIDPSFNCGQGPSQEVDAIAIDAEGRILIGGYFAEVDGNASAGVARLNSDGSFDPSFNVGTGSGPPVRTLAIQADGKVVCGGQFTSFNGTACGRICRLSADGSLDPAFNTGTGFDGTVRSIVVQPDGKLLVGGDFDVFGSTVMHGICRLNSDGSVDPSFDTGNGTASGSQVWSIALLPDGRMMVGGDFDTYDGQPSPGLARVNANGSHDASFVVGTGMTTEVRGLAVTASGQVMAVGMFVTYNADSIARIVRIDADGTRDASFDPGEGFNAPANTVAVLPDGSLLVGGEFAYCDRSGQSGCLRLSTSGAVDLTFNPGTGAGGTGTSVRCIVVQSDERIIIGGTFRSFNGQLRRSLCRLNNDGSLDETFITGEGFDGPVYAVALQPDGKLVVGGAFHEINGVAKEYFCRLNADGSLDAGFATSANTFNGEVHAVLVLPDGKIIVGGNFDHWGSLARPGIARCTAAGGSDSSFDTGTGAIGTGVNCLALQPDGKIIVAGYFNGWDGDFGHGNIVRLNANGTTDDTFDPGSGAAGQVHALALQPSGRILIGGEFIYYNSEEQRHLVRMLSNGSRDLTFDIGSGFNDHVHAIAAQSDGHILVGGEFESYDGHPCVNIARLNSNGDFDGTFQAGTGCDSWVYALATPSETKALVGGSFVNYNGTGKNRIMRIFTSGGIGMDEVSDDASTIAIAGNPVRGELVFSRLPEGAAAFRLFDAQGVEVRMQRIRGANDLGGLASGPYTLTVHDAKGRMLGATRLVVDR